MVTEAEFLGVLDKEFHEKPDQAIKFIKYLKQHTKSHHWFTGAEAAAAAAAAEAAEEAAEEVQEEAEPVEEEAAAEEDAAEEI